MKKGLLTLGFCALAGLSVVAVPAKKGIWKQLKLQNGTTLMVELKGDEFLSYWQDANGNRYVQQDDFIVPAEFPALQQAAVQLRKQAGASVTNARRAMAKGRAMNNYEGDKRCLIILVQFSDQSFSMSDPNAFYTRVANEKGFSEGNFKGSVSDYFSAQSLGKLNITFDVVGPYTLGPYATYGKDENHNGQRYDVNPQGMISAACASAAAAGVNFQQYDWDGDGQVEEVYVIYAGEGQATGGSTDTIWPHKSQLSTPTAFSKDGTKVFVYACSNELKDSKGNVAGIGTICHEFSHCLGYPDFYDINYGGKYGMGTWDLMCSGNYNGDGFQPVGYTAYERYAAGWIDPIVLEDDCDVTDMKPLIDGGNAYIYHNPSYTDEYYIIENRQQKGWDATIAAPGIIINHVDYSPYVWSSNCPNSIVSGVNDHERMVLIPADNNRTSSSETGDAWPWGSKKNLTNATSPYCEAFNDNKGSNKMNIGITNMAVENGVASFKFANYNNGGPIVEGTLLSDNFDRCAGTGGNDEQGFIPPKLSAKFAMGEFLPSSPGWEGTFMKGAYMCARVGNTSATQAQIKTPQINLENGVEAVLTFKGAPYGNDGTKLTITVEGDGELGQKEFTMTYNQWTEFKTTLKGKGKVRLVIQGEKRYFLDDVLVVPATTGISGVTADKPNLKGRIYTTSGVYVGTEFDVLPQGVYVVNGKKVVK